MIKKIFNSIHFSGTIRIPYSIIFFIYLSLLDEEHPLKKDKIR